MPPRPPGYTPLHVGVGKLERGSDAGQRCCSTEISSQCKTVLVKPVAGPRARKGTVSTALCRAGIELRDAAPGAHCVGGLHWVNVGVVAEGVLGRGGERAGRVTRRCSRTSPLGRGGYRSSGLFRSIL